jgi:hypothetical protein
MHEKLCVVSTVRSTADELLEFTHYHLNVGIDQILLFFDDPQDPALAVLDGVSPRVIAFRCDTAFWRAQRVKRPSIIEHRQLVNANLALAWARQHRFDWIIHIDSDELLLADTDLRDILSAEASPVVRFPMKEAVAERESYPTRFHATLFREPLPQARIDSLSPADRASILFEGEYFRGHTASKAAIRVNSAVKSVGIHGAAKPRLPERQSSEITLLHYDCIGLEDWKRKWERRLDGSGTADGMRPGRLRQLELFKRAYGKPAQERELYARLHMVSESQRERLIELGVMSAIDHVPGKLGFPSTHVSNTLRFSSASTRLAR